MATDVVGSIAGGGGRFWSVYTQVLAARGNHDMDYPYSYAYVDLPDNGSHYYFMEMFLYWYSIRMCRYPPSVNNLYGQYEYMVDALRSDDRMPPSNRCISSSTIFQCITVSNSKSALWLTGSTRVLGTCI